MTTYRRGKCRPSLRPPLPTSVFVEGLRNCLELDDSSAVSPGSEAATPKTPGLPPGVISFTFQTSWDPGPGAAPWAGQGAGNSYDFSPQKPAVTVSVLRLEPASITAVP